jgi:hypothetical protein
MLPDAVPVRDVGAAAASTLPENCTMTASFTRLSLSALPRTCNIAIGMCGEVAQGIELAVGTPHPIDGEPREPEWAEALANLEMTPDESAEFEKQEEARHARIEAATLSKTAQAFTMRSHDWLTARYDTLRIAADPILAEALDVAMHDSLFIGAKLHRALDGRARHRHGEEVDDDPVQNDWNGSAKVALISLERSEAAWRVITEATSDPAAHTIADAVRDLRALVHAEFPRAMAFVRPGFDEPWR